MIQTGMRPDQRPAGPMESLRPERRELPHRDSDLVAAGPRERDDAGVQKTSERSSTTPRLTVGKGHTT